MDFVMPNDAEIRKRARRSSSPRNAVGRPGSRASSADEGPDIWGHSR